MDSTDIHKKIPLLLGSSSVWIKFYLVVTLKDNVTHPSKITYKTSHLSATKL